MSAVTGPPSRLLDRREDLTPMLAQYVDRCEEYDDALVLFRVGDFYKTYCEAAEAVARICELTLIEREDSTGTYAAAGIPVDNAASYLDRLLDAGHRLAIADQVEDPDEADGLVERRVTQVITPGTVVADELLAADDTTYVAAVARASDTDADPAADGRGSGGGPLAFAYVDVSTGECAVTSAADPDRIDEELARVGPAELVVGPGVDADFAYDCPATEYDPDAFTASAARETLSSYVGAPEAVTADPAERAAVGGVLAYAEYTQGDDGPLSYVARIRRYDPGDHLRLDATAIRGLELFERRDPDAAATGTGTGGRTNGGADANATAGALVDVLDRTETAPGRRLLSRWLRRPLLNRDRIEDRLDAVEELRDRSLLREEVRDRLGDVYDVERLIGRVSRGRADARDLRSLATTLAAVPDLREALADADSDALAARRDALDDLGDVRDLIEDAIPTDPAQELTEGGVIRDGFDDDLDDLRATEREGREWVANLEERERERTGIDTLEVGHTQVHGYYIEVTNSKLDRVPDDYTRRQTLKNSERFYTPELKRREDEILGAAERADALEYDLFREVRASVGAEAERVQAVASALAELDVVASLAAVAAAEGYVRPEFVDGADDADDADGAGVRIEGGRHPVVERAQSEFVPNDADLPPGSVAVITGPNMSGKSTYMRQVALTVVLAQTGSFVPADRARLPVVDRVFTRVGASDDIAGGESTFMREMSELTDILHDATADSLILLDEVGRGTSTADGLAIARATTEFLHDQVGAYAMFATHYHDLTALADERERVFNLHFAVTNREGDADADADEGGGDVDAPDVTFLHTVAEGAASSSYGVEVARMAGVPAPVVERSRALVAARDADESGADLAPADDAAEASNGRRDAAVRNGSGTGDAADPTPPSEGRKADAAVPRSTETDADRATVTPARTETEAAVAADLRALDVARTTPLEALNTLHELKSRLDGGRGDGRRRRRGRGDRERDRDRDRDRNGRGD